MVKGRLGFIAAVIRLLAAIDAQAASSEPKAARIYGDIYLQEKSDLLVFDNSKLTLEIGKASGRWLPLFGGGVECLHQSCKILISQHLRVG